MVILFADVIYSYVVIAFVDRQKLKETEKGRKK